MLSVCDGGFEVTAKLICLQLLRLLSNMAPVVQCGGPPGRYIQCMLQLTEGMNLQTFAAEAVLALTQVVYGEMLVMILPAKLGIDIWICVHVAIAGLLAQLAGTTAVRTMEYDLPVHIHTPMCRKWAQPKWSANRRCNCPFNINLAWSRQFSFLASWLAMCSSCT